jgi:hypothetical protein
MSFSKDRNARKRIVKELVNNIEDIDGVESVSYNQDREQLDFGIYVTVEENPDRRSIGQKIGYKLRNSEINKKHEELEYMEDINRYNIELTFL